MGVFSSKFSSEVVARLSRLAILWDVEGPPATSEISPSHLR
jgi:hypothetical protein